ncbi:hypothetical protein C1645_818835 [Glomus cerebriforme]|uniref:Uncharacterized protein n=1 Tax=Glomus cerebriforme TaxID=658196 RepID=A0A397TG65_9GLOM|nr:hypothetical protein C1645_818835 [Glomus cerebriforme]
MSNITTSGTLINLWCIVRKNRSIFKITIGSGNDLDDLRKVIKKERKPHFDNFASDELTIWRTNVASNVLRNKETAIEPYLNEKLEDPADTVGNTFQNVVGNNIRVIVSVPVTEQPVASGNQEQESLKRYIEKVIKDEVGVIKGEVGELRREVKKVRYFAEAWLSLPGINTETEKGQQVVTQGTEMGFPLSLIQAHRRNLHEKFQKLPNLPPDAKQNENNIQEYFINECSALKALPETKLYVENIHSIPLLNI